MVGRDPLQLLLTALMQLQVGPVHTSAVREFLLLVVVDNPAAKSHSLVDSQADLGPVFTFHPFHCEDVGTYDHVATVQHSAHLPVFFGGQRWRGGEGQISCRLDLIWITIEIWQSYLLGVHH